MTTCKNCNQGLRWDVEQGTFKHKPMEFDNECKDPEPKIEDFGASNPDFEKELKENVEIVLKFIMQ